MNDDTGKIRRERWEWLTADEKNEELRAHLRGGKLSETFERELTKRGVSINAELSKRPSLWHFIGHAGPNVDQNACLALLQCLETALENPRITASVGIYDFVSSIYSQVGNLDAAHIGNSGKLEIAFAKTARGKSAAISARALRNKSGFDSFKELCLRWFADPAIYGGKMEFYRDVIDKGWCKTEQTARSWLKKVRADSKPIPAWAARFETQDVVGR